MNILFITHYGDLYGSIRSLMDLTQGLQTYGINAFFVVPREGSFSQLLDANHIPYKILPVPWWMAKRTLTVQQKYRLLRDLHQSVKEIRKLVKSWKIDLVYTNTSVIPVGELIAMLEGLPHIWHIREFGDLDFSLKFVFPKSLSKFILNRSDAIICHAKAVREHWFKPDAKRVHPVYNGCATRDEFDTRLRLRNGTRKTGDFVFAMVSAVTPGKGQETAIRALAKLRQRGLAAKLLIAGSGKQTYLDQLKQLVEDLNLTDWVEFKGFVEDPFEIYSASDCVLICSEHEALSRVGLEAMSTALPLIGKNSGGNPEIIVNGETGFLYDTSSELADLMTRMIREPGLGRTLGLAGWGMARERFNIEIYAANVYQIIKPMMN